MKKLISSFLAEMQPLWLKQRQQNDQGRDPPQYIEFAETPGRAATGTPDPV